MNLKKLLMIALFSFGLVNSAFANTESNKSVTHQPVTAKKTFNQLTKEEQNEIIQFEKSFKPELRAEVREFLFNDKKQTVENLVLILNKQSGRKYVRIKDGLIKFHYLMPSNEYDVSYDRLARLMSFSYIYQIDKSFRDIIMDSLDSMFAQTIFNYNNNITKKELEKQALDEAMEFHKQGNYIEAADLFEILAEDGRNGIAQFALSTYYLSGAGVKKDIGKAKKYLKLACSNGIKDACEIHKKLTQ